jgi:tetratricopeptide (TPR) repeat protein
MRDRLVLRFSVPDFDHRPTETFGFTPQCSLESNFGPELGTAIAGVAASMALPTVRNTAVVTSTVLEPTADKLAKLVGDLGQTLAVDRGALLQSYGLVQLTIGAQSGDGLRLKEAADALRTATNALSRKRVPFSWALSQKSLGTALMFLGNQEVGTDLLKQAVSAFQAALDEWTGDQMRAFRGATLHHLGLTLSQIGQRESGSEHLKEGIDVLRAALKAESGKRSVAHVQASLGAALTRLAEREGDERCLEEAIVLTRSSVDSFLFQFPPMALSWARGNVALASALTTLGEWKGRGDLLEEAANTLKGAAKVMSRKRAPLQWVDIQIRLAATLIRQGELDDSSTSLLHQSVSIIRAVLDEPLRVRHPYEWARAQDALGVASLRIGMREDNIDWLQAAETAFRDVLDEVSHNRVPAFWAEAKNGLASTLAFLGAHRQDKSRLEEAIGCFHEAAEVCTRQSDPMGWAFAQHDLAFALISLGVLFEAGTKSLEEAARTLRTVLEEWTPRKAPAIPKRVQPTLETALSMIRARSGASAIETQEPSHVDAPPMP